MPKAVSLKPRSRPGPSRAAFSLIEMLVVIGVIMLLIGLVIGSVSMSRAAGRMATCASNQREIGQAFHNYKQQERRTPSSTQVLHGLGTYLGSSHAQIYRCPEVKEDGEISYGVRPCVPKLQGDSNKIVLMDAFEEIVYYEGFTTEDWEDSVAPRHLGTVMNVMFYDGSVTQYEPEEINPYTSVELLNQFWKPTNDDETCRTPCGLNGRYYTGHWTGNTGTRVDGTLHMPFGGAFFGYDYWDIPLAGTNDGGWDTGSFGSATWSGSIKADETGDYVFRLACDNEAWLIIDGATVIHRSAGGVVGVTTYQASAPVSMTADQWVDIEVRLLELTPSFSPSHVSILWTGPNGQQSEIPCENLRPR